MKKNIYILVYLLICNLIHVSTNIYCYNPRPPKLTVVFVIDQFAHHYINKLYPHLRYGLKYLLNHGVVYTNAHVPHGQPGTGVGHAGLNTGTYANDHGIISNSWRLPDGTKIECDDDKSPDARVIIPTDGTMRYDYGKSSHYLMADGITDQCVLQSTPLSAFKSFSISGKSRSAIMTASKLGKALWPDPKTGLFTSSGAYFEELPEWVKNFNETHDVNNLGSVTWQQMYPKSPHAYKFFDTHTYDHARKSGTLLDRPLPVNDPSRPQEPFHFYDMTPHKNQHILNFAQECVKEHVGRRSKDRLFLWVCLSPLDVLGHQYGPHSIEAIDMIYHLDKQLQKFIRSAFKAVGKHRVVFALTADHGITPIPEILEKEGLTLAHRINPKEFVAQLNEQLNNHYSLQDVIKGIRGQEIVLNHEVINTLNEQQKNVILDDIKALLLESPYIKEVWRTNALETLPTQPHTILDNIKNQVFKGRSGELIIQPYTYSLFTGEKEGTSHSRLPYDYNTHVPLILLNQGKFERKYVRQRVTSLQLANTLAEILNVPKPSASTQEILPELFDPEYQ